MMKRLALSSAFLSHRSFFVGRLRASFSVLLAVNGLLFCGALAPTSFGQGSKRASAYDSDTGRDQDRPDLRDRWMMRGRSAPPGKSAAQLRLRAHQQKMQMREAAAARMRRAGSEPETGTSFGPAWLPLGPAPLISDQNFFGAVAGRTTAVAIDPTDTTGNTVYVASASGGVWKSTNAADATPTNVAWTALTDQQASLVNGAVSVKPDGTVVLVGTGEANSAIDSYYGVGILRSTNQGASWISILTANGNNPALSFAGLGFAKFAWSASPATTVVAATATTATGFDEGDITNATNRGLYYSNDSGQTWTFETPQDAGTPISPASISATDVVYDAAAGKFFAAIRYHGVYSSTNGQSWTRLPNQPNAPQLSTANCPAQIANGGASCPIYRGQFAVVPGRNEIYFWFVSLTSGPDGVDVIDQGIWRSTDGGNSWAQIDESGIANCGDPGGIGCGVGQGYYNLELAAMVNPGNQATDLYAGAVNLFKCELARGASTCSTLDSNLPNQWINLTHVYGCSSISSVHPDEHGLDFMIAGGQAIMYFANDGGVYRTLDGFSRLTSGTCGTANLFDNLNQSSVAGGTLGSLTQFVSLSLDSNDQDKILGGTQDNGSPATSSATTSSQWTTANGGDGGYNGINGSPDWPPNEWYTANPYVNIYMCPNGIQCTDTDFSLTVGSAEVGGDIGAFYTPYILDPQDPYEMLVGTCRVWRGAPTVPPSSFSALSADFDTLGDNSCSGEEINLVRALDAGGPRAGGFLSTTVYATTEGTGPNAASLAGGEVWVTTNAGILPMAQVTGAINPSHYTISSVAIDTSDKTGATAYVGIMGFNVSHVFKTMDAGGSGQPSDWMDWTGSGGGTLTDAPVNALLVDGPAGRVYAGTDVGVFWSSTVSSAWTELGTSSGPGATGYLPNVPVTAIRMFNSGGIKKLRVSTYGRGIWEYDLTPGFLPLVDETPDTSVVGQTVTWNGTLTAFNGYASNVNLSCVSAAQTTCTVNPASLVPTPAGAAFTMTLGSAEVGTFSFSLQASDGTITHTQAVSLTVGTDVNWTDTGNTSVTVQAGQSANYMFSAAPVGGATFTGAVNFSCANLPALTTCNFNPASIAAGAVTTNVTLTIATTGPVGGSQGQRAEPGARNSVHGKKRNPPAARTGISSAAWLLAIPLAGFAGMYRRSASRRGAHRRNMPGIAMAAICLLSLAAIAMLAACGALGGGSAPATVTVSPSSASVWEDEAGNTWPASDTQLQFTAKVNNASSQTVTWAVEGGSANGTIDPTGLYTAPASVPPTAVTVTATSAQASSPGTAAVTIKPATPIGNFTTIQVTATAAGGPAYPDPVTLTVN